MHQIGMDGLSECETESEVGDGIMDHISLSLFRHNDIILIYSHDSRAQQRVRYSSFVIYNNGKFCLFLSQAIIVCEWEIDFRRKQKILIFAKINFTCHRGNVI